MVLDQKPPLQREQVVGSSLPLLSSSLWRILAGRMMSGLCKEDWGCEKASAGWRLGVSCWRPEVYVGRTYVGNKCAGQAFKVVPRIQIAAGCVLSADVFAVSCPQVLFPIDFGIL